MAYPLFYYLCALVWPAAVLRMLDRRLSFLRAPYKVRCHNNAILTARASTRQSFRVLRSGRTPTALGRVHLGVVSGPASPVSPRHVLFRTDFPISFAPSSSSQVFVLIKKLHFCYLFPVRYNRKPHTSDKTPNKTGSYQRSTFRFFEKTI